MPSDDAAVLVPVEFELAGVSAADESDAPGVSVVLGELSPEDEESAGTTTAPVLRVVGLVVALVAPLFDEVRTVADVGTEAHDELESATDACAARELTSSTAIPNNARPTAAPSAAGLRSSALTVHPRFSAPV